MRAFWFWLAILIGLAFAIGVGWLGYSVVQSAVYMQADHDLALQGIAKDEIEIPWSAILTAGGVFLAALANLFAIVFGWRKDRREAHEFKIRIAELERKLATG